MKKISLVSSCYNEANNIEILTQRVTAQMDLFKDKYEFEYILLDNGSTDNTADKLKEIASKDKRIKVIINARNFGHICSPYYGISQTDGDAVIYLASDLQDPPELISQFIKKWENGTKIVLGMKTQSEENFLMFTIRKLYYEMLSKMSDSGTILVKNCTGFGLYDKQIVDILKNTDDPYPYLRGKICEIGFEKEFIEFKQPNRFSGNTKNNFYTLYDNAMLGVVKHSKVPLRIMTMLGFATSFISIIIAMLYFILKLVLWNTFDFGIAPLIISMFFFGSVQLFCLGILGEYIGAIYTRIDKKPMVIEKERINF